MKDFVIGWKRSYWPETQTKPSKEIKGELWQGERAKEMRVYRGRVSKAKRLIIED